MTDIIERLRVEFVASGPFKGCEKLRRQLIEERREAAGVIQSRDEEIARRDRKIQELKQQIAIKDRALHARNVALDGMAWVWCDGGCSTGTGRFSNLEVTEEMVSMIERNAKRLRTWFRNRKARTALEKRA